MAWKAAEIVVKGGADHLANYSVLFLDMNSTFMFGEDRFGDEQDYAFTYRRLGGTLPSEQVNVAIASCYAYLDARYSDPAFYECFPSVADALHTIPETDGTTEAERALLEHTFALHERGRIPPEYATGLKKLAASHCLALIADIWSEKDLWLEELARADVLNLFEVLVFSSALGCVKPSPIPFRRALKNLDVASAKCLMIGDSVRRDLGGAQAAGLDALWIGEGIAPPYAISVVRDLLELTA